MFFNGILNVGICETAYIFHCSEIISFSKLVSHSILHKALVDDDRKCDFHSRGSQLEFRQAAATCSSIKVCLISRSKIFYVRTLIQVTGTFFLDSPNSSDAHDISTWSITCIFN